MTLTELANLHRTDKGTVHARCPAGPHGYAEFYGELLGGWRNKVFRMLEIGVAEGGSLRMWRDFFGRAFVWGLDVFPRSIEGCTVLQGRQEDPATLAKLPEFDLVVDDGGHEHGAIVASFEAIFPRMPRGSIYIVEDLHVPGDRTRDYFRAVPGSEFACGDKVVVIRK